MPSAEFLVYLSRRDVSNGPLFCTEDGRAVSRQHFTEYLALIFRTCGLDPTKYKGHSFRIGAATRTVESGLSNAQIRLLGRWKCYAFRKYIRSPGLRDGIVPKLTVIWLRMIMARPSFFICSALF